MKSTFAIFLSLIICVSCARTQHNPVKIPVAEKTAPTSNEAIATFAQGCFWHTEIVFQSLVGVRDAVSGYSGGKTANPTYESVSTGLTGHAECVQVYYNPDKISFKTLVEAYFASMDPTTVNRQGNDEGTEYRSMAFYRTEEEKQVILEEIGRLESIKKYKSKIVIQVVPFSQLNLITRNIFSIILEILMCSMCQFPISSNSKQHSKGILKSKQMGPITY